MSTANQANSSRSSELRVYNSPYPAIAVPVDQSISQFLCTTNPDDIGPDKVILQDFDDDAQGITHQGLFTAAVNLSAVLSSKHRVTQGDVVCIFAENSVRWVVFAHSVLWGGGVVCAVNSVATSYELVHYLTVAKPILIAVDNEARAEKVHKALQDMKLSMKPEVVMLKTLFPVGFQQRPSLSPSSSGHSPASGEAATLPPAPPFDLSNRDNREVPAFILFSSGTSGVPKGVLLSHHNLIAQLLTSRASNPFLNNAHTREVFYPPFAHIYGLMCGVLFPAWVRSFLVAMPRYDFDAYVRRCSQIRATVLRIVPATAVRMLKDPMFHKATTTGGGGAITEAGRGRDGAAAAVDLASVKLLLCAGAALSAETAAGLRDILDPAAAVLNGYGMSEATIALLRETTDPEAERRANGSVGRVAAGAALRVVDDDGRDVSPGVEGEFLVAGPTVFMGYVANPAATEAAFADGRWLRTGDVGRVDDDGLVWLTARKKELIKYKGNQVPPAELEAVLLTHDRVAEAGVCGMHDKMLDTEVPVAFVVLKTQEGYGDGLQTGAWQTSVLDEIRAYVDERVAPYKKLRGGIYAAQELPKGSSGKLLRRALPDLLAGARKLEAKL